MKIEKFTCTGLPFSGVTDDTIREKLKLKDTGFFTEEYLLFLTNPEETGASFIKDQGSNNNTGPINLDLIKEVNVFISQLSEAVKQLMISKIDRLMVIFDDSRNLLKIT